MAVYDEQKFKERFLPATMKRVVAVDVASRNSESGCMTHLRMEGDVFFIDEIAPFTKSTFNRLLRLTRNRFYNKDYESEYLKNHDRLPGSMATKRLRKKRRAMITAWYAKRFNYRPYPGNQTALFNIDRASISYNFTNPWAHVKPPYFDEVKS